MKTHGIIIEQIKILILLFNMSQNIKKRFSYYVRLKEGKNV